MITEKLIERMHVFNSLACCGLDPDITKFPKGIIDKNLSDEEKIELFLKDVVDVTNGHVCAYKIQKAFFDVYDNGHALLKKIISYIHKNFPDIPVFIDCKIGDIDNTMNAYAYNVFDVLGADGVLLNPYMGDDVFSPFKKYKDKALVVLVKTSNSGGDVIQNIITENGVCLWEEILKLAVDRWNVHSNIIPVVSSNIDLKRVRSIVPDKMPMLLAGVGAQGGNIDCLKDILNSSKAGIFINSSRGILYSDHIDYNNNWKSIITSSVEEFKLKINRNRR